MKKNYLFLVLAFLLATSTIQAQLNILLVNDNGYAPTRVEVLKTSLDNLGYTYTFYDCPVELSSPSLELMEAHSLVIWYTGNDASGLFFWNGNETVNQDIKDYIDGGGMFWVQGLDFIYDVYGGAPDTFVPGDFLYDYLGIEEYAAQSHVDDGVFSDGVPQLDVVPGNGIFTLNPIEWTYSTMWYVDALFPATGADSVYRMGPTGYDFDEYFAAIYNEKGDGKVLTFTFETAKLDSQTNTDTLFSQGLQYFGQFASNIVYVNDITVTGEGGATTINVNQGTLQMDVAIQPPFATNGDVIWSVVDVTTTASIDQDGLLQATGTTFGNGTVWVKADAVDGSGVSDSLMITISNQGSDFEILLVNDNANGLDRYKELDTTLSNLNYSHDIYHTMQTGTYPDLITLSYYDVVIWYTGNDGFELKLWDLSNPDDYKFNAPLISYLDVGGVVWLQGLDFFYDIFGAAPDTLQAGQFIYDYMGVKRYAAQSWLDDGYTGVEQLDIEAGNPDPLCAFTPIEWTYSMMHYVDGLEIAPTATGIYRMGPPGYILDTYLAGVYNEKDYSKLLTFTFETARIDTEAHTDTLFSQVLTYFKDATSGGVPVTNITVTGEGGATTIDVNNATLQMNAAIEPVFATNQVVYWSVVNATGTATIDQNGLLQASGFSCGNGTVWAKATATDGSGVSDSLEVTISNQGTDFEVLLVNDNNRTDRYLEIDTTLSNLGYNYFIYNTAVTDDYPDFNFMECFDVVIWYTGNDYTYLKLWDLNSPDDYKFNDQLIQYLDNEGIVWLQGLDFMYDVFGGAPDTFEPGQFVYDYMGIKTYAAQSYVNDGGLGLPQLDAVPQNPLCTLTPVEWVYTALNYADGFEVAPSADSIYRMGPAGYPLDTLYSGVYNQNGLSRIFTLAVETARIDTEQNTDTLFSQVLESFKNISPLTSYTVNLTVYLEGPYDGAEMATNLNDNNLLPLAQPFNAGPWDYLGTESVDSIPNTDVVDWVLVELRDAPDAASANSGTRLIQQAAFLLKDGSIVDLDGTSALSFTTKIDDKLFAVVRHKNHLGIMSAGPLSGFNNNYNYNFTTAIDKAFGTNAQASLNGGAFGMYGGDANADGEINAGDRTLIWNNEAGTNGYLQGDANMDTQADNKDKNDIWFKNNGENCQVPD
ncbi:MAG: hypothetical protein B6I19_04995 [Bacteroidetes bacterium 4572_114]|nr:MAG: hypothetical protein B6I19_04995 [Bacteroidetes bacterium 4572_114]